jgi:large subunit ribosomal protein L24
MKIKKGDNVQILAGKDRGKAGVVTRAIPDMEQVIVDGVNMRKRHTKANKNTKQGGGIVEFAAPINVSNVAILDPKTNKPTRVGVRVNEKTGKRERYAKKSGTTLA